MKAVIAVPHGTPIEIRFADEARVGQQGTLTRIWARRGSRPRAPRDRSYISAYLFGAVCPDLRILTMPPGHTEVEASTCSNLMSSTVLRRWRPDGVVPSGRFGSCHEDGWGQAAARCLRRLSPLSSIR